MNKLEVYDRSFIKRIKTFAEQNRKTDAVGHVYDYFGGLFNRKNYQRTEYMLELALQSNIPAWLLMPFLTISRSNKTAARESLYNHFIGKYSLTAKPDHIESTIKRLN